MRQPDPVRTHPRQPRHHRDDEEREQRRHGQYDHDVDLARQAIEQDVTGGDLLRALGAAAAHERAHAGAKCVDDDRLRHVVIRACVHAIHQVLGIGTGGEQENINIRFAVVSADAAADFDAVHARHHPVENGQPRCVGRLKDRESGHAVGDGNDLESP